MVWGWFQNLIRQNSPQVEGSGPSAYQDVPQTAEPPTSSSETPLASFYHEERQPFPAPTPGEERAFEKLFSELAGGKLEFPDTISQFPYPPNHKQSNGSERLLGWDREDVEIFQEFGRFQLFQCLHTSPYSTLWRNKTIFSDTFFQIHAMKHLPPIRYRHNPDVYEALIRSVTLANEVIHPGAIWQFELLQEDGSIYILQEYCHGVSLWELLKRCWQHNKPLPIEWIIGLALSLTRLLEHTENLQIAHGCLTPKHILLPWNKPVPGMSKVTTFGQGWLKRRDFFLFQRFPHADLSPAYWSPEHHHFVLHPGSDLFSLGVILWECLANRPLFHDKRPFQSFEQVTQARIADPQKERPDCPKALAELVMQLLQRSPEHRVQSASEAYQAFYNIQTDNQMQPFRSTEWVHDIAALPLMPRGPHSHCLPDEDVKTWQFQNEHNEALIRQLQEQYEEVLFEE